MTSERPTTLLAELTHRCPLHCPYCSNPLELMRADERARRPTTGSASSPQARALGVLQLGLSGGEPLIRKDLEELAAHARGLGLYTTLVTSGLGLTRKRAERYGGGARARPDLDAGRRPGHRRADRRRELGQAEAGGHRRW